MQNKSIHISLFLMLYAALAFSVEKEWTSKAGIGATLRDAKPSKEITEASRDYNADGVKDLVHVFNDTIFVVNGANRDQVWTAPISKSVFEGNDANIFLGFYDLDASSPGKEFLFGEKQGKRFRNVIITSFEEIKWTFTESQVLTSIMDYDNDGDPELLIGDRSIPEVAFYGKGN